MGVLVVMLDLFGRNHLGAVADEVGRQLRLAHLRQVTRVAAVVPAHHDQKVHLVHQQVAQGVLTLLGGSTDGVEEAEVVAEFGSAESVLNRLLDATLHFLSLPAHHRGLVGHAHRLQVQVGVESGRVCSRKFLEKLLPVAALADVLTDVVRLGQIVDHEVVPQTVPAERP